ncbi:MAG: hypothetical protein EOM91_13015 [Sphingobacteriia bacterium]|nr:hypothetical protein [Sphingobacteriia bacterium]NCC39737.1 hypothetical protein [Gammaproteobacteria bacterium]
MQRDFKIPKLYKTLLMLALVFGPFYWLAFTEDGQWRTDLALMFLLGKPEINLAVDTLTPAVTEGQIRETFPKLALECADGPNPFGQRLCAAAIGAFNGIPAASLTLFSREDQLTAVKIQYRRAYHQRMRDWVEARVAEHTIDQPAEIAQSVASWTLAHGRLVMRDGALQPDEEPALFWLARTAPGP